MNLERKRSAYREFFQKSEGGQSFVAELERLIVSNHEKAEQDPALSRDYVQRAAGIREILTHIKSVTTEVKKGGRAL